MANGKSIGIIVIISIVGIALLAGLWYFSTYNTLVAKEEGVKSQWAQVESVYQRRLDLVPNLANTVKGYADLEELMVTEFAQARQAYAQSTTVDGKVNAANQIEATLSRIVFLSENYPDLKASANFRDLMAQLEGTENRISVERMRYNDRVAEYNSYRRSFPASMLSGGFAEYQYFKAKQGADVAPTVTFA